MSENIQSISQGTYTIGETNKLSFEAGPGIKIDEPSAGTVRIGNDETVLYSGNLSQGNKESIPLSEPITNFEKFKVYGAWNYNNDCRMYSQVEIDTVNSGLRFDLNTFGPVMTTAQQADANCYFTVGSYKFNTSTAIDVINAVRFHTNLGAFSDSDTIKIYKVIGINRISGSNA